MLWEDEPPAQSRVRRMQSAATSSGDAPLPGRVRRGGPGMPFEMDDPDDDAPIGVRRFQQPGEGGRWWRPSTKFGRIFFVLIMLLVLGGFTSAIFALRSELERDPRFRIAGAADIQASGLTEVSRADMLPVFGEDIGRNIFFVPLSDRRRQLESIPWIERATVMRVLPDQIRVNVVERQPVAFTRQGQQIGLVDANGILLNMPAAAMAQHHYSFPVVTGIDRGDPVASRKARMAVFLRLMAELDSTGRHYSEQISEIDLTDPEDARVLMPEQGADILAHFGEDHFLERYQRYQAHIAEWRQQYPHLAAVDLRYDQQVVMQMASGTETSASSSGSPASSDSKPSADGPSTSPATTKSAAAPKKKPAARKHTAPRRTAQSDVRRDAHGKPSAATHAAVSMAEGR
jgi:cell division protein FtsQ